MMVRAAFWSGFSVIGVALVALPASGILPPRLLYNPSESAPPGWYRIIPLDRVSRGDLVVSSLPETALKLASTRHYLAPGVPVIKTVGALDGDKVCETDGVLEINGTPTVRLLPGDRLGRALPSPWKGCRQLQSGEVLLLSDRTPESFDGRYFGAVRESDIIGRAVWLGDAEKPRAEDGVEESGGRSECKIKAHGAKEVLSPCLHIDFYGSTRRYAALWFDGNLNDGNRLAWFHSRKLGCFSPDRPE